MAIAARLNARYEAARAEALAGRTGAAVAAPGAAVWLSQPGGDRLLLMTGRPAGEGRDLADATVFEFQASDGAFVRRLEARAARWTGDRWTLDEAVENRVGAGPSSIGDVALPPPRQADGRATENPRAKPAARRIASGCGFIASWRCR